jgi:ribosome biogenesis GTPase / thiamine phosphate phosphatase
MLELEPHAARAAGTTRSVSLEALGWSEHFSNGYAGSEALGTPHRVVAQQRGQNRVSDGERERWAHVRGRPIGAEAPVIGDWVVASFAGGEPGVIEAVLPRRSAFSRRAAGDRPDEQVIAANIDIVFLMSACDGDLNPSRMERYLVAAWQSGAQPVVLLNKSDLAADRDAAVARLRSVAAETPIHLLSLRTGEGLDAVRSHLLEGITVGLLGSSGVGKSTLVNVLLGEERQRTQILTSENRGRHTTTHRELFQLPGGGLMIDTPGMRELQLWESPHGLDAVFPEIQALAAQCQYGDCGHGDDEGCAVVEALEAGTLDRDRYERFRKLKGEQTELGLQRDGRVRVRQRQKTNPAHHRRKRG